MKKFKKAKFWRIASEGATTDGREISRDWLQQMADNYNPSTYTARINMEHIRGLVPDSAFRAYGDVLALKTETINGKLVLLAQLDPTDDMIALIKKRQKVFTSMEVDPDFAKTGSAYLVGLGITDSPASLGTEMLQFSAQHGALNSRKLRPENLFSSGYEVEFELDDDTSATLVDRIKTIFSRQSKTDSQLEDAGQAIEAIADEVQKQGQTVSGLSGQFTQNSNAITALQQSVSSLSDVVNTIKTQLDSEQQPGQFRRSKAPGSNAAAETDC